MTPHMRSARWRALAGGAASAGLGGASYVAGRSGLHLPAIDTSQSWARWWDSVGPLLAVFSIGRALVMLAAVVAAAGFAAAAVELSLRGRSLEVTARLTILRIPIFGPLLRLAIGLAAAGAGLAACGSSGTGPGTGPPPAPTLVNSGPPGTVVAAPAGPAVAPSTPTASTPLSIPPPDSGGAVPATAPSDPPPVPAGAGSRSRSWLVRPGDSLWSIAEAVVGGPTERVAAYWEQLMTVNQARLPDPNDPSLLFPGDLVILPSAPGPGT